MLSAILLTVLALARQRCYLFDCPMLVPFSEACPRPMRMLQLDCPDMSHVQHVIQCDVHMSWLTHQPRPVLALVLFCSCRNMTTWLWCASAQQHPTGVLSRLH
jgi:hypothetical protein